MRIWVDADGCPNVVKEIICRAAIRAEIHTYFVANHAIQLPRSPLLTSLQVQQGFDVADDEIALRCETGDLVVTSDIPLAADVIAKGATALNSRGEIYTNENVRQRLNMRDFMDTMRASGIQSGGPPPLGAREKQAFANGLDRLIAKSKRRRQ